MLINQLQISGYRSIKNIDLKLGKLNVIVGANGTGKSNLYRALHLLGAAAEGRLGAVIAREGGMSSALWAGKKTNEDNRFRIKVLLDDFSYALECGLIPLSARVSAGVDTNFWFSDDPEIKSEELTTDYRGRLVPLLTRKRGLISARNMDGRPIEYPLVGNPFESVLSSLREPHLFPDLSILRQEFLNWRFYHHFRTDLNSPLRREQLPTYTPVLSHEGVDLASALASIMFSGGTDLLSEHLGAAFPGSKLKIEMTPPQRARSVAFSLRSPGVNRPFSARELSDGTLQYMCLLAALLTERPPNLMVLNEPETSLHPDLMEPLAGLLVEASKRSQLIVTTHATELAEHIRRLTGVKPIELEKINGATSIVGARLLDDYKYDDDGDDTVGDQKRDSANGNR
jgi:predicted ATPase